MGGVVVYPDSSVVNTGTVVGGGTWPAQLGDGNDATLDWLEPGDAYVLGVDTPTIPADAVVTQVAVILRALGKGDLTTTVVCEDADGNTLTDQRTRRLNAATWSLWYANVLKIDNGLDPASLSVWAIDGDNDYGAGEYVYVSEAIIVVSYIAQPVVDVTAPTGTLTEVDRPQVIWSVTTDPDGGGVFASQVKIFTDAQYGAGGFDPDTSDAYLVSGTWGAENTFTPDDPLPDDTYRAYVRAKQYGSEWSTWDYSGFTLNVDHPGAPTLTVEPDSDNGRNVLTIDDTAGENGRTTDGFEVQAYRRSTDEWVYLRTVEGAGRSSDIPATVYDYEAEYGTTEYRVRAFHTFTASEVFSAWTYAAAALTGGWWIKHPTTPSYNVAVELRSFRGYNRPARVQIEQPLDRPDAVAAIDERAPQQGEITFRGGSDDQRDRISAIASQRVPVWLQAGDGHHEPDRWVVLGDEGVERLVDRAYIDERDLTYSWTQVARPPDDTLTAWDVLGTYPEVVLADEPALFWRLNEADNDPAAIIDSSGHGRHGKLYTNQVAGAGGWSAFGFWAPPMDGDFETCGFSLGAWSGAPLAQQYPGTGIKADDYKPFIPGAKLSLECWLRKTDPESFATIFSSDADDKPATTLNGAQAAGTSYLVASTAGFPDAGDQLHIAGLTGTITYTSKDATHFYGCSGATGSASNGAAVTYGVNAPHPTWEMGDDGMMRFYPNVNTYPLGWVDWGTDNTGHPDTDFDPAEWNHIVCCYDDVAGRAEWYVNGVSQGAQTLGYLGTALQYDALSALGNLQFGYRGGPNLFPNPGNTEVYGGFVDEIAVYEYILSPQQVARHFAAGRK